MSLARYILRRLLLIVPTLFGVSLLTFALSRIVPGDPARLAAGAQATPEMYAQIRQEFGLDLPLPVQYWNYLTGIVQGDWGRSILSRRPVVEDLRVYWPATLELVLVAMTIAVVIGVPLGVIAAVRADRPADQVSRLVALIGVSLPAFWLAILLQLFFGLRLGWFPISGRLASLMEAPLQMTGLYLVDSLLAGKWSTFGEALRQIILPAITLSFPAMATIMRFTRASLLEVMGQDYVRTARAKGAAERRVIVGHALRNALIPTITMIGLYATKSALTLDFMPIMGIALLYGLVFSLINIVVDITYGVLDPRVSRT
jgi:peptide/nickel transport system permease protein